jgi:hypothetical protein
MEELSLLGNFVRLADYLLVTGVTGRALAAAEETRSLLTAGRAAVGILVCFAVSTLLVIILTQQLRCTDTENTPMHPHYTPTRTPHTHKHNIHALQIRNAPQRASPPTRAPSPSSPPSRPPVPRSSRPTRPR